MLTCKTPAPVRVLTLVSVAIGDQLHLHDPRVLELVEGGVEHGGDEVPAAGTQGLVVERHLDRGHVLGHKQGQRVEVAVDKSCNM